jgi:phytoene desaturase
MSDPFFMVSIPSRTDSGLPRQAGTGFHVYFPVPNLTGRPDWSVERARYRDAVLEPGKATGIPAGPATS